MSDYKLVDIFDIWILPQHFLIKEDGTKRIQTSLKEMYKVYGCMVFSQMSVSQFRKGFESENWLNNWWKTIDPIQEQVFNEKNIRTAYETLDAFFKRIDPNCIIIFSDQTINVVFQYRATGFIELVNEGYLHAINIYNVSNIIRKFNEKYPSCLKLNKESNFYELNLTSSGSALLSILYDFFPVHVKELLKDYFDKNQNEFNDKYKNNDNYGSLWNQTLIPNIFLKRPFVYYVDNDFFMDSYSSHTDLNPYNKDYLNVKEYYDELRYRIITDKPVSPSTNYFYLKSKYAKNFSYIPNDKTHYFDDGLEHDKINYKNVVFYNVWSDSTLTLRQSTPALENIEVATNTTLDTGLHYLTSKDLEALSNLPKYIADNKYFEWTHKEYVSNVFYKTLVLQIDNEFEDNKSEESKSIDKGINVTNYDIGANAFVSTAAGINNIVAQIPILSQEYPTNQFLSSSEPTYQFNFISKNLAQETVGLPLIPKAIETLRALTNKYGREYKFIPDGSFILIDSFVTRLFGSFKEEYINHIPLDQENYKVDIKKPIAIESTEHRTLESSPGATAYTLRFSESNTYDPELFKEVLTNKTNTEANEEFMKKALDLILSNCDLADVSKDYVFKKNAFESNPGDYLSFTSKYFTADDFLRGIKLKKPELIKKLQELDLIKIVDHNLKIMAQHLDNLWDLLLSFDDIKKGEGYPLLVKSFSGIKVKSGLDFSDSETRDTFSQHYFGSAVDIIVPGYNVFFIAELIRRYMLKQSKGYGLGIYGDVFGSGMAWVRDMGDRTAAYSGFIHFDLNLNLTSNSYDAAFTQYCSEINKSEEQVKTITKKSKSSLTPEEKDIVDAIRNLKLNNKITDTDDFTNLKYNTTPRLWSADKGGEYAIKEYYSGEGIDVWKDKVPDEDYTYFKDYTLYDYVYKPNNSEISIELYLKQKLDNNTEIENNDDNDDENQERSEETVKFKTEIVDYKVKLEPESARLDKDFNPNYSGGNILTYNSWKERLEQVFGEKSSDLIGTSVSDTKYKDLTDAQRKAFQASYKNRSLNNDTEVSIFTNTVGNIINADPGYFKDVKNNKQLKDALDDYFNANGLVVYYDRDAQNLTDTFEFNKDLPLSFYIADPSSVGSFSENATGNYNNREIINLIKMACNLKDLASVFLIEPEIYLENKDDVQKEYEMIQKELYGISPIPSFFNNLTFGVCGSLLPTAEDIIQAQALFTKLKTDYTSFEGTSRGFYLFYNFINKSHPNYESTLINKFLTNNNEGFVAKVKSLLGGVVAAVAIYFASIPILFGAILIAINTALDGENLMTNNVAKGSILDEELPEVSTNLFRLLENISRGTFVTSLNTSDDVAFGANVYAKLDRRALFNRIYVERENNQEPIYSFNQLVLDLEDSDNHQNLVNSVIRQFVEQNPVMQDYQELASTISVNNALKSLINFEFLNSNTGEKEKSLFVGKDIFDPFIAKDWILFLISFRHTTQFFGELDDEEFDDCYVYNLNQKAFTRKKEDSSYIPAIESPRDSYLIERNLGESVEIINEKTMVANVPRVYRYENAEKRKNYFQKLKEQNKVRLAYLKNLLVQIVESLKQYDFFANNLSGFGTENQIEFDFATENAYPDIDLPLDPANPLSNINISPGFFYVKNFYSQSVLEETKAQATNILQKSYNFMSKLETGVYSGDAADFKNQSQDSITKGVIVDMKDSNLTVSVGEFNNQLAILGENSNLSDLIPKIKFDSELSNTDLDYTDISLITIQEILNPLQNNPEEYLQLHVDSVKERAATLENSFGSRAGFINETSVDTLNFFRDFDDRNNTSDETNKLLGLSNDSNISVNVLQEIADVSGNKLLENQFDISKAYPTFKFYLIEEDSIDSDNIFVFDDFYSFNAVKDFTVYKSRKLAADTAVIRLQNISGTLDGTKFAVIRDVDYEINDRIIEKEQFGQVPSSEPIQSVVLRPGVCCQLRAGYSSNPKDLTILLSGRIADVAWSNNGDMCEVTVQSFAVELETRKYGASDIDNGLDEKQFHSTHKLLGWCLFRNELKHFGRYKKQRLFQRGESKDVVITKETHIGAGDPSTSASMFEFFMSNWGYFVAAEVALCFVNFGALVGAGKEVAKVAVKEVAKEAVESTAATAGAEVVEAVAKEAVEDAAKVSGTTVLNIFSRNVFRAFGFGKEVVQNIPNWLGLGKLIRFVSGSGLNINASTKLINAELAGIEKAIVDEGFVSSQVLSQTDLILKIANQNVVDAAAQTSRLSNVLAYLGSFIGWQTQIVTRGSTLASRLWSINPTSLNVALEQYVAKGFTGSIENQATRIAIRNLVLTEITNASTNLWATGLRKAFQAVSLGAMRAVKLGVILPVLTYSVGLVWDTVSSVLSYFYNLVMGTFNPYSEALVLSPQDDALYAPHPDRYIVGSSGLASVQSDEAIKRLKRALAIGYLFYDPSKSTSTNEDILLNRTLLMDKRLNAKRGENVFKIKNSTIWEIFHEMSLRHPGWVYGARQYGQSLEYRMFFGLPNQRYFGKPLGNLEIKRLNSIIEATSKEDEDKIISLVSKETRAKIDILLTEEGTKSKRVDIMKTLLLEEWTRITKDRFIPFRNYHLISSKYNLVANNISGSNNDVINEIAILYLENNSGSMPQYTQRVIRAHDNMTEDQVHAKAVKYDNCKGFNAALRYGTAELVNAAKEMYRGEIIILGNPQINPYDICILEDEYSEMFGPIEVEAVTHIFSMDTGFITEIKPNALVTANEGLTYPVLNSVAMYDIGRELSKKADYNFRSLGDDQKKTLVTSIVDKWLEDNVKFMTMPWEKDPAVELGFTGAIKLQTGEINPDFKQVLIQRTLQELEKGNIILQSDILNPNANLGGFLTTENISATLASLGLGLALAKNRLGATPAVLVGLLGLGSSQAPTILDSQLSTPGSFLVNKLLTGDMLISQVTDGNLIQVYPLFKNNRPLVYGGYQKISLNKSVKNKLGNIFFEISEAMTMFNAISKEYSSRENIIYNRPTFVIEQTGNIAEALLPFRLPAGTVTGYLGSYTRDQVVDAASTGGRL